MAEDETNGGGESNRVEIGFDGGQVMVARLSAEQLDALKQAVASTDKLASEAGGWYELESTDGAISLDLRKVVFVRRAAASHTIGFSGA
ncbi:MAG: hypothetical protein ACRDL1_11865 [Solirubrobacterales bacterium]|jgi:hypothetical protein